MNIKPNKIEKFVIKISDDYANSKKNGSLPLIPKLSNNSSPFNKTAELKTGKTKSIIFSLNKTIKNGAM